MSLSWQKDIDLWTEIYLEKGSLFCNVFLLQQNYELILHDISRKNPMIYLVLIVLNALLILGILDIWRIYINSKANSPSTLKLRAFVLHCGVILLPLRKGNDADHSFESLHLIRQDKSSQWKTCSFHIRPGVHSISSSFTLINSHF